MRKGLPVVINPRSKTSQNLHYSVYPSILKIVEFNLWQISSLFLASRGVLNGDNEKRSKPFWCLPRQVDIDKFDLCCAAIFVLMQLLVNRY